MHCADQVPPLPVHPPREAQILLLPIFLSPEIALFGRPV